MIYVRTSLQFQSHRESEQELNATEMEHIMKKPIQQGSICIGIELKHKAGSINIKELNTCSQILAIESEKPVLSACNQK